MDPEGRERKLTPTTETQATPPAKPRTIQIEVPIGEIVEDRSIQVRGQVFPERVEAYRKIIKEHGVMDRIDLFCEDPTIARSKAPFFIADGFHRIAAYRLEGIDSIPARLHVGTKSEAIWYALQKNGRHGVPLTNAEKRNAANLAVLDPIIGNMTDKQISQRIGCSATLVAQARRGETKQQTVSKAKERQKQKIEKESAAPRSVTTKERKPLDITPTKSQILRQTQDYLTNDVVDEADLLKLMEGPHEEYRWVKKPGEVTTLVVVGKSGRVQARTEVLVKEITLDTITLRYEGDGKVTVEP